MFMLVEMHNGRSDYVYIVGRVSLIIRRLRLSVEFLIIKSTQEHAIYIVRSIDVQFLLNSTTRIFRSSYTLEVIELEVLRWLRRSCVGRLRELPPRTCLDHFFSDVA